MARKSTWGRGRGRGNLTAVIGKSIPVNSLVPEISVDQGVFANDTLDQVSGQEGGCIVDIPHSVSNHSEAGSQAIDDLVRDDHIADNGLIDELIIRYEYFDCHNEDSNDDSILIGNYKEDNVIFCLKYNKIVCMHLDLSDLPLLLKESCTRTDRVSLIISQYQ
jgi:hypothetical protein